MRRRFPSDAFNLVNDRTRQAFRLAGFFVGWNRARVGPAIHHSRQVHKRMNRHVVPVLAGVDCNRNGTDIRVRQSECGLALASSGQTEIEPGALAFTEFRMGFDGMGERRDRPSIHDFVAEA